MSLSRGEDFKDAAEIYWLSWLDPVQRAPPVLTPQVELPTLNESQIKKEKLTESNSVSGEVENSSAPSETTAPTEEPRPDGECTLFLLISFFFSDPLLSFIVSFFLDAVIQHSTISTCFRSS